jgi:hypothetical protein
MVIVMVTVCFIYRPPILRETFNSWMMRFAHLGAQIGLKPMPCLNLNWIRICHWRHTRTRCFLYGMEITDILLGEVILTAYILKIINVMSLWILSFWRPSLTTFQICWLLCMTSTSNILPYVFYTYF